LSNSAASDIFLLTPLESLVVADCSEGVADESRNDASAGDLVPVMIASEGGEFQVGGADGDCLSVVGMGESEYEARYIASRRVRRCRIMGQATLLLCSSTTLGARSYSRQRRGRRP
jgi:hypothetical protein